MFRTCIMPALVTLSLSSLLAACGEVAPIDEVESPLTEPSCLSLADALELGDGWRVGMEPLDPEPRPSIAKPGSTIRLWISSPDVAAYRALAVDAEVPVADESFPRGAAVVREIFDADGRRTGVTVACRAQAGYNPDVGDLWFASRPGDTPDRLEVGRISSCNGCHTFNDATQGLYGPMMPGG